MNQLAPIGIITYKRIKHLKRTVEALQNNYLAKESDIFFFSDAPKVGDENEVNLLRDYLKKIDGFKSVSIIYRNINSRKNNSLNAQKMLLEKYGKLIFLEEDMVTSKYFLTYMNDMLISYQNEKKVFAICAYVPNIIFPENYQYDYFFSKRISPWGFATWKDRESVEALSDYNAYLNLTNNFFLFIKGYMISRKTVAFSLRKVYKTKEHRGDALFFAKQLINSQFSIVPTKSLINNIGLDGSGQHSGINPEYKTSVHYHHDQPVRIRKHMKYDKNIDRIFCQWYNRPKTVKNRITQLLNLTRSLIDSLFYNFFGRIY